MSASFETLLREGVKHFNQRKFWEAHESWEKLWLGASNDMRRFLQGLIQLAAAYHHLQRGTFSGGVRLFDAAQDKLGTFPVRFCGIDRSAAIAAARHHRTWMAERIGSSERIGAGEFPHLLMLPSGEAVLPDSH